MPQLYFFRSKHSRTVEVSLRMLMVPASLRDSARAGPAWQWAAGLTPTSTRGVVMALACQTMQQARPGGHAQRDDGGSAKCRHD
jgi:hypothetical protein